MKFIDYCSLGGELSPANSYIIQYSQQLCEEGILITMRKLRHRANKLPVKGHKARV